MVKSRGGSKVGGWGKVRNEQRHVHRAERKVPTQEIVGTVRLGEFLIATVIDWLEDKAPSEGAASLREN